MTQTLPQALMYRGSNRAREAQLPTQVALAAQNSQRSLNEAITQQYTQLLLQAASQSREGPKISDNKGSNKRDGGSLF